jgi:4-hydroxybenzoate polyprenyltransferase
MKKLLLRLGDYVFVMRPLILIPAWSFYLLGAAAGERRSTWMSVPAPFLYGFACLSAILVTAYLLNQVFDQESDRRNRKGHYLTLGIFSVRTVVLMAVVAFLLASYFFRSVSAAQRIPLVLALVLSLAYSLPPLRLVARPFVDLLSNAVGYGGVAFVTGFASFDASIRDAVLLALPYFLLVGATFLHTTILDVDGDRDSGKITTSVVIGERRSAVLACVLAAAGLVPAVAVSFGTYGDRLSAMILGVCFVVFLYAAVKASGGRRSRASSNAVQAATVMVTLPAAISWPIYFTLLAPIIVAARFYYRARFGINYPGPAGAGPKDA